MDNKPNPECQSNVLTQASQVGVNLPCVREETGGTSS